jgi:SM-20-related protein
MENSFEALIASYIENKVGICEHLSDELVNNLKKI